jgi:glucokinase
MSREKVVLGVDIGGTKVAAGVVDSSGNILYKTRVPMNATGTAQDAMDCVHTAIRLALDSSIGSQVSAIGVASPGPLALPEGVVLETPNLPCWRFFNLGDAVRDSYGLPTRVDNDANAAGLAEALWGAGRGSHFVFYATVGTGIGTAIVINDRIFYGRTGVAPEGGHMSVDYRSEHVCGCGKHGCIEVLAAGPAIARRARLRLLGTSSPLARAPETITAKTVAEAWRAGDPVAKQVLQETADLFTVWFGNVIDLIEPDVIVVGGGVGKLVSEWFDYIHEHLPAWSINSRCQEIPLKLAKYGSDAGIAGAAALCFSAPAEIRVTAASTV